MDKLTEYILQENKLNNALKSMKVILPNIKKSLLKGDSKRLGKIADKLPKKDIKSIEREAIRRIPTFKKDFSEAQRKVRRVKEFNKDTAKPAAIAVALVSSSTKYSVDDVLKEGKMRTRNLKSGASSYFTFFYLCSFGVIIGTLYTSGAEGLAALIKTAVTSIKLFFSTIAWMIEKFKEQYDLPYDGRLIPSPEDIPDNMTLQQFIQTRDPSTMGLPEM